MLTKRIIACLDVKDGRVVKDVWLKIEYLSSLSDLKALK